MMKYFQVIILALIYGAIIWLADPTIVLGISALILFGALPMLIILLVLVLTAQFAGRSSTARLDALKMVATIIVLTAVAIPLNRLTQQWAVAMAHAYPDHVAPLLEEYRRVHGFYPKSLDDLHRLPWRPRLIRKGLYRSDGQIYEFYFPAPGGFVDDWYYDSKSKSWSYMT